MIIQWGRYMMKKSEAVFQSLKQKQLIALLSPKSPQQCVAAYDILSPLGIILEIAFRTPAAEESIQAVLEKYPSALVLAGTVMTQNQAEKAVDAGVAGIVSADYIPIVVEIAVQNDIMCVSGGLGDVGKQLVQKAELYRCELDELRISYPYQWIHKIFPAVTGSQNFFEIAGAWKGPFKELNVVYTGGVSSANLADIANFDPNGIFCGSALVKSIDDPDVMREEAQLWSSLIKKM